MSDVSLHISTMSDVCLHINTMPDVSLHINTMPLQLFGYSCDLAKLFRQLIAAEKIQLAEIAAKFFCQPTK